MSTPDIPVSDTSKYLNCWYTNADSLTNKLDELEARLNNALPNIPDLLIITEIKPKNYDDDLSDVNFILSGYIPYFCNHNNRVGRGILIYSKPEICV